jgi:hypothetical protein
MLSLTGALWLATTLAGPCYLPSDQTVGWKRVEVPEEAPALAAPAGFEQFRAGERAFLSEADPQNVYLGASKRHFGRMAYTFRLPKDTYRLTMDFLEPLNGAKVDVTAYLGARAYPLLSERRQSGRELRVDWNVKGVDSLVVVVHHHVREEPVVRHWRVDREVSPPQEPAVPASFKASRALYFWHPGGRRIELCDTPGQPLVLSRLPEGTPATVTLTRSQPPGSPATPP